MFVTDVRQNPNKVFVEIGKKPHYIVTCINLIRV
jgi:hypothetical protein